MKLDIPQLLIAFDELLSFTDEEQGVYWFKSSRPDGIYIVVAMSVYESKSTISVYIHPEIAITSLLLKNCSEVRVLDSEKKLIEILHGTCGRCFLSLLNETVLEYVSDFRN